MVDFWWDFKHNEDGSITVGIETTDKSLTFDGNYVCLVSRSKNESSEDAAIKRVNRIIELLKQGLAQVP